MSEEFHSVLGRGKTKNARQGIETSGDKNLPLYVGLGGKTKNARQGIETSCWGGR